MLPIRPRAYLTIIDRDPVAVERTLAQECEAACVSLGAPVSRAPDVRSLSRRTLDDVHRVICASLAPRYISPVLDW